MISFVVPAYNEEAYLGAALQSIHDSARANALDYEIVVANDGSTDATAAIAAGAGARVVTVQNRQISRTRNDGARAAKGDRLVFLDADTQLNPAVLCAAVSALDAGAVGGGASPVFDEHAPRWAPAVMAMVVVPMRWLGWAAGCFFYCRRDAFEAVGGFDERHFAGEEVMLSMALKKHGRIVMLREPVVTSSRKFKGRSLAQTLWLMIRISVRGMGGVRRRDTTQFWYDGRR